MTGPVDKKSAEDPESTPNAPLPGVNDSALVAEPLTSVSTDSFPVLMRDLGISLLVTTYQAGRLIVVRHENGGLNTHFRLFSKPMGLACDGRRFAIGTHQEIRHYRNVPVAAARLESKDKHHDACYVPAAAHVTGDIDIHEMSFGTAGLWFINTKFSTLCTSDPSYSFAPHWRPAFVTALTPEDRCHLNGLSLRDGKPRYVTALGETDAPGGWRENKRSGGILMDIERNQVICRGLSMPHSPRWHLDRLWLLESGHGNLSTVDLRNGQTTAVTQLNGFTRGIDFHGPLAFIGLSKVRESATFAGLPLTDRTTDDERECGIWVVNVLTGQTVAFLRFTGGVKEIFAVSVVPHRYPEVLPPDSELIRSTYVVPDSELAAVPDALKRPPAAPPKPPA